MTISASMRSDRAKAALGVAAFHGLLGYALLVGLGANLPPAVSDDLKIFDIASTPPPPVERTAAPHTSHRKREGAASPPNLRAKATEIAAPVPAIRLDIPPPVIAAPTPFSGNDPTLGAAAVKGPGTGSGGQGQGTGSGGRGSGEGGGGDDGTPPRWIKGHIHDSDYPRAAYEAGIGGSLYVRFTVGVDGRVGRCLVLESSGNADLDETTCRLIQQRMRYEPARDERGRPVPSQIEEGHEWVPHPRGGG